MLWQLKNPETNRLTPFARSLIAVGIVLAASIWYFLTVGLWVATPRQRERAASIQEDLVVSVEVRWRGKFSMIQAADHKQQVAATLTAFKLARTRIGPQQADDGENGFIRFNLKSTSEVRDVVFFFPGDNMRDQYGPEVALAVQELLRVAGTG